MKLDELVNRLTHHAPDGARQDRIARLRSAAIDFALILHDTSHVVLLRFVVVRSARARALELALMWAVKGIVLEHSTLDIKIGEH